MKTIAIALQKGGTGKTTAVAEEIRLVERYTGWDRFTAEAAIAVWKRHDPEWGAGYIAVYLGGMMK